MPIYDGLLFDPPAPLARVVLRDPLTGKTAADVPMLMDSGADVTLLPTPLIESLGLDMDAGDEYELTAFDGSTSRSRAINIDLLFLRRTFKGRFLIIDQACGILGRDILNHLSILLNGPKRKWEEHGP
ncbi:MAG TPA: retropepsin-like aspartic protease [Pirellulales bacterium]|nr:retropepsin-like aspartic protease [Pirellulales bacterium]